MTIVVEIEDFFFFLNKKIICVCLMILYKTASLIRWLVECASQAGDFIKTSVGIEIFHFNCLASHGNVVHCALCTAIATVPTKHFYA